MEPPTPPDPKQLFCPGSTFEGARFDRIVSPGIDLTAAEFSDCHFLGCKLPGATLRNTTFERCTFEDSDLSNTNVTGTRFIDCSLKQCKLIGINWTNAHQPIFISATRVNLSENNFFGIKLNKLRFHQCLFHNTDFREANLSRGDFSGSDFFGAQFVRTDFSHADFRGALNYQIDVRTNSIRRAQFSLPEAMTLLTGLDVIIS